MNILFIIPKLSGGGAEHVVARLANALCREHRVYILITYPDGNPAYYTDPSVTVREIPRKGSRYMAVTAWRAVKRRRLIRDLKKEWRIDCSISFLRPCNSDNVHSKAGELCVVSSRCILSHEITGSAANRLYLKGCMIDAARNADVVVGVSRNVSTEQIESFHADPSRVVTIYNPCSIPELLEEAGKPVSDPAFDEFRASHPYLFATSGRLCDQKGQWHAIRALREVRKTHPEAGLLVLGTGPLEEYLKKTAEECGVREHVYFAGYRLNAPSYLANTDSFIFPSHYEGFPNALLEAMALGLPVIASDCNSGPRELLAPETDPQETAKCLTEAPFGILLPCPDGYPDYEAAPLSDAEEALKKAMLLYLDEPYRAAAYGDAARKRAADFDPVNILAQWRSLLEIKR